MLSFIKLDENYQAIADGCYINEKHVIEFINQMEKTLGNERWFSIGRTDIEKGFMALRKGITERYKEISKNNEE